MTKDEIEHMWKVASNDPHHDFNWFDPVVVKFAQLVTEKAIAEYKANVKINQKSLWQKLTREQE